MLSIGCDEEHQDLMEFSALDYLGIFSCDFPNLAKTFLAIPTLLFISVSGWLPPFKYLNYEFLYPFFFFNTFYEPK